ncbi:hypothetical protein BDF19DRAFT_440833 [Syncephalis fuscata]|nr:hypothetical protein BDF19DRAFT_440833 [Syncephalis fuscata]
MHLLMRQRQLNYRIVSIIGMNLNGYRSMNSNLLRVIPKNMFNRPMSTASMVASIVIGVPLTVYLYKCLVMTLFQRRIIYVSYLPPGARQPTPLSELSKTNELGSLRGEEVLLKSRYNTRLQGYVFNQSKTPSINNTLNRPPIIIYFQGNAGNMLHRIPVFERILSPLPFGTCIVAIHTRGYGGSGGRPTQHGIRNDALRILDYTIERYRGAVAAHLVLDTLGQVRGHSIRGLILENTFTNMEALVAAVFPRWMPYKYLAHELVPSWMTRRLAHLIEATNSPRPIVHQFAIEQFIRNTMLKNNTKP